LYLIYSPNKNTFEKNLFTLDINQLKTILENIRTTISINSNKNNFMVLSSNIIKGIELLSIYSGYDITGLESELMKNEDF